MSRAFNQHAAVAPGAVWGYPHGRMSEPVLPPPTPESDAAPPTDRDRENARNREEIAARQAREYGQVLAWAQAAFGEGWLPSHRHFLLTKEAEDQARYTG